MVSSDSKPEDDGGVSVPLVYVGIDETPIEFMNQFVVQVQGEEFILTLGSVAPPLIIANTPEERRRQAEAVRFAPVRVLGRYGMTRQRLGELVEVLTRFFNEHGEKPK